MNTHIAEGTVTPQQANLDWLLLLLQARTFVALIVVFVFFSIAAPNFLSTANAILISKHVAINAFLAIGILSDGPIMMGVSSFWQMVLKGLVIIAAMVIDQAQSRLQTRVAFAQEAYWRRHLMGFTRPWFGSTVCAQAF
jgi:predicted ABC-type sugar transport system permease subunit